MRRNAIRANSTAEFKPAMEKAVEADKSGKSFLVEAIFDSSVQQKTVSKL